jgi:hypothetical protein
MRSSKTTSSLAASSIPVRVSIESARGPNKNLSEAASCVLHKRKALDACRGGLDVKICNVATLESTCPWRIRKSLETTLPRDVSGPYCRLNTILAFSHCSARA